MFFVEPKQQTHFTYPDEMRLIGSWTTSFRQLISETSLRSGRFAVTCYSLFTSPVTEIKRLEQAPISKHLNSVGVFSSHHFCFLSFVTTQTDASVVLCKSCPHRSLSSGIRNTTIVVTWSLVIQKYLCVLESPERTLLKKNFDRCRETRHRGVKTTQSFDHTHMTALGYNQNHSQ